jgi:O-methyltransferase involved in polyketide biosynthesis
VEGLFLYLTDEAMDVLLDRMNALSARGSRITADHMPGGTSAIGDSLASRANEELTAIWVADQQHDPVSWLLGHGWTTGVSRLSWVAGAYGRPMTDLKPESLRVMQLVTGELD